MTKTTSPSAKNAMIRHEHDRNHGNRGMITRHAITGVGDSRAVPATRIEPLPYLRME